MEKKIRSYQDLKIWQQAMDIVVEVYRLTSTFPKEELYGLTSQMRRAAISIASNIAEGFARYSDRDYPRFLHLSLSSCAELETQTLIAIRLSYTSEEAADHLVEQLDSESRMTMSLIRKPTSD